MRYAMNTATYAPADRQRLLRLAEKTETTLPA